MTKTGFYRVPASLAAKNAPKWEFVSIPNLYRPARYKASIDLGDVYISLTSVEKKQLTQGKKEQYEVLHFRAANPAALREKIEQAFPQAVFTLTDPVPDMKAQYATNVKADKERQAAADAEKQFDTNVVSEYRKLALAQPRAEQLRVSYSNFNQFATNPACSNEKWVNWFRQRPGFLSWPDNSWENRDLLLEYCEAHGWIIPVEAEIAQALNYLMNDHFYMKSTYKRSERDERAAVRPYTGIKSEPPMFTQEQIEAARKQLIETRIPGIPIWPVGSTPSMELILARASAVGIGEDLLEVLLNGRAADQANVAEKSSDEIKADLQKMRNASQPQPVAVPAMSRQDAKALSFKDLQIAARKGFKAQRARY